MSPHWTRGDRQSNIERTASHWKSLPMDLRFLRYFVTVAEELNFTRAARVLHITQPSLSVQVRKLESEVGAELLTRDGRGIRLTQAGRLFLTHARKILAEAERAVALARRTAKGEIGELSIGYST